VCVPAHGHPRLVPGFSSRRPGFAPGSLHVGFVVVKVALGQVSLRGLLFPSSVSCHRGLPYSYITWGMNSRSVVGRSSEILSCPIDVNVNPVSLFSTITDNSGVTGKATGSAKKLILSGFYVEATNNETSKNMLLDLQTFFEISSIFRS
jgi:hypothetical protein